jgi:hypothetical protein
VHFIGQSEIWASFDGGMSRPGQLCRLVNANPRPVRQVEEEFLVDFCADNTSQPPATDGGPSNDKRVLLRPFGECKLSHTPRKVVMYQGIGQHTRIRNVGCQNGISVVRSQYALLTYSY